MGKKDILTFGNIAIKKNEFYGHKSPIFLILKNV